MKSFLIYGGIVVVIIILFFVFRDGTDYTEVATFSEDTTVESYTVNDGESVVLENSVTLTVEGDLTINGSLECRGGDLKIVVEGNLNIVDRIYCTDEDENSTPGVSIVVKGEFNTEADSEIVSDGNIQIVEDESLLLSKSELDALYDDTEKDSGEGQRVGPFVDDESEQSVQGSTLNSLGERGRTSFRTSSNTSFNTDRLTSILPGEVANAQAGPGVRGNWRILTPPKGIRQIVFMNFPSGTINVADLTLTGPDGRKGTDDKGGSCNAKGSNGENAFRFNASAPNIKIGNFTLNLGNGGAGGDAETTKNCDPGTAKGGNGGKSGNFRMTAGRNFEITGSFIVNPGKGGKGGEAIAHGKDGGPSEDGGDAKATGGIGAKNKKKLTIQGSVAGASNVQIGNINGGKGGEASADPGDGGAADTCGKDGGKGGDGNAIGGKGGDASVQTGGSAVRSAGAKDIGGDGGDANAHGGKGGAGGSCDHTTTGGDGGDGGDATSKEGQKGIAKQNGNDGSITDETAGDGGNGGDGCVEGKGGDGGSGDPDGKPGEDGKNLCQNPPKQPQTSTGQSGQTVPGGSGSSSGGTSGTSGTTGGDAGTGQGSQGNRVKVIQFMDYYIPVDQLRIVPGHEPYCSGDHWHPAGPVTNTMGFPMQDPQPDGCGFGLVSQLPVMEIEL